MLRFFSLSALLAATCSATAIPASSRLGSSLLSKARLLNDNNNNDGDYDFTWVSDYSIRFDSCHTTLEFRADGGGSADEEDGAPTESMRLVHFKLCPSNTCDSSCTNGADYLVEMREFVESYLEFQMTQQEYNCEKVQENCDCENANDDENCLRQCYVDAGLDYCQDDNNNNNNGNNNNNNGQELDIEEYLECERINEDDGYTASLYVGAYCANNGKSIHLGTFSDRQCTNAVTDTNNAFYALTGTQLPYTTTSIVGRDCISCKEPVEYDDDYNADQYDADQVVEICEELYERSAKCERNLAIDSPAVGGCDYMFNTLPAMERLSEGKASPAAAFAWTFGVLAVCLAGYVVYLHKQKARTVNLTDQEVKTGVSF